jgi:hypothetical protein
MSDMEKINALSEKIEKMHKQALNSTKVTAIGYLIVVLFVFGYTTFIMNWIKAEVSADKLSASMRVMIEGSILTDENREAMVKYCREQAPVWAEDLVQMTHQQLIPTMKLKVKGIVDKTSDDAIGILKRDLFPQIKELVIANAKDLDTKKDITDQNIANELAKILADECEREMDVFVNDNVKRRIGILRDGLHNMAVKPYRDLTQKEGAKRRLLVNWVYLMEHHEAPSDIFGEFLKGLNRTYEGIMKDLTLSE